MLSQAEHDEMASAILVTTDENFAKDVEAQIYAQLEVLPKKDIAIKSIENYEKAIEDFLSVNSNKWVQKNDLPLLLFKPGAVVVNNEIIILGGQTIINGKDDCSKKVFIYIPKMDKWVETTPLPAKNVFFGCTTIDNKIYVIGGTVGGNPNWESYSTVYEGEMISNETKK